MYGRGDGESKDIVTPESDMPEHLRPHPLQGSITTPHQAQPQQFIPNGMNTNIMYYITSLNSFNIS